MYLLAVCGKHSLLNLLPPREFVVTLSCHCKLISEGQKPLMKNINCIKSTKKVENRRLKREIINDLWYYFLSDQVTFWQWNYKSCSVNCKIYIEFSRLFTTTEYRAPFAYFSEYLRKHQQVNQCTCVGFVCQLLNENPITSQPGA